MVIFDFYGALIGYFLGSGQGSKTVLGSTHVIEKLLFPIDPSILTFNFDLIFRSFWLFGALMGYFWGWGRVQKLFWGLVTKTKARFLSWFTVFVLLTKNSKTVIQIQF